MAAPTTAAPLADFRRVVTLYENQHVEEHFVHHEEISAFVSAHTELHHTPGINPHTPECGKTLKALQITVFPFISTGPYWWSTPGLCLEPFQGGATIFSAEICGVVVWADEDHAHANSLDVQPIEIAEIYWREAA